MKYIKFLIALLLFFNISINLSAASVNKLILKAHHPKDTNTIIKIWKTPESKYIFRTSYSSRENDFDQEILYPHQKKVEYEGFAKTIIFQASGDVYYVIALKNSKYSFAFGFFSEALNDVVSVSYIIDYINKELFYDL